MPLPAVAGLIQYGRRSDIFPFIIRSHQMRDFLLAACVVAIVIPTVSADEAGVIQSRPEQRAAIQTQFMKERLNLPADVLAKIQGINLKYAQQMDPVLKGADGKLAKMQKGRAIMAAKDAELKGILSPSQFEAYDDAKDDIKAALESRLGQ
jgi:hypothetical protein